MTNDMTLTLNALPARDSDKGTQTRGAAVSQPAAPPHGVAPVSENPRIEAAARSERPASVLGNVPEEDLQGVVSQMQDFAQLLSRELQFNVDEDLGRTVVRVLDKETGELIRQIPSDEALALAKQMQEMREAELEPIDGARRREEPVGFLMKTQA
jgi:flagellar protein FlaG